MKKLVALFGIVLALLVTGCSFRDGIYVILQPTAATQLKNELAAWVLSRGFEMTPAQPESGFFAMRRGPDGKVGLFASLQTIDSAPTFFIGKGNTRDFSADEIAIVGECALWLASRADLIERGSASKASTTAETREQFYAKIKKS